ncbi:hypothetical protein [Burkholderia vietnamiensis]|uniref:hypothetical protein n=1 Tax=Burkholderia vietnamiensis TaxID=60552 RepID=UPI002011EF0C|nr:hypothetical protein [Burkholderia vietnamiensis]
MVAVHVTLKVEPKRSGGRGRARVLERVEREVLAGIAGTPTRDGLTVLQVSFACDDAFGRRADDLAGCDHAHRGAASLYHAKRGVG